MFDHNVMDGSDSTKNTMNGVFGFCAGTIQYNYFNYVVSGILDCRQCEQQYCRELGYFR